MILKDIDTKDLSNKYLMSGFKAEKQMSFYLNRAFGNDDYVAVINDLHLEMEGEYAQIDHLVIHRFGFVIIESKSVTSTVCVNKNGEWKRIYNGNESGMASPIQQAKRQVDFLKKFLMSKDTSEIYRENMANKYLPRAIDKFDYSVLVAISDDGIIERDIELSEICKADMVTDKITQISDALHAKFKKLLTINIPNQFHEDSITKLSKMLVNADSPIASKPKKAEVKNTVSQTIIKNKPELKDDTKNKKVGKLDSKRLKKYRVFEKGENHLCKHCKSPNVNIEDGRYGFYLKCFFCNKNTALKLQCTVPTPNCSPILKKRGLEFFRTCEACNEEKLFFTNIESSSLKTKKAEVKKEILKDEEPHCLKCESRDIKISYGKYGYYIQCKTCQKNSKISLTCTKSSCKPKLKKEKEKFYKVCSKCKIKALFFTNI